MLTEKVGGGFSRWTLPSDLQGWEKQSQIRLVGEDLLRPENICHDWDLLPGNIVFLWFLSLREPAKIQFEIEFLILHNLYDPIGKRSFIAAWSPLPPQDCSLDRARLPLWQQVSERRRSYWSTWRLDQAMSHTSACFAEWCQENDDLAPCDGKHQTGGGRPEVVDHAIKDITYSRGKHRKGGRRPGAIPADRSCTWCTTHSGNMTSRWMQCVVAAEENLSGQVSVIHVSIRDVMCMIFCRIDRLLTCIHWTSQYISHVRSLRQATKANECTNLLLGTIYIP
jgi:hypothetical protein